VALPLRSTPVTGASSLLRTGPPARPQRYSMPHSFCCPARSLSHPHTSRGRSIGTRLPAFHTEAADQAHATCMPDTTWPINGHPPGSSRSRLVTPVSMSLRSSRHVNSGRLPGPHLTPSPDAFSLNAQHNSLQLMHHEGDLTPPPQGDAEGPTILHLLCSTTSRSHSYLRNPSPRSRRNQTAIMNGWLLRTAHGRHRQHPGQHPRTQGDLGVALGCHACTASTSW
jgi:hypothetical protein